MGEVVNLELYRMKKRAKLGKTDVVESNLSESLFTASVESYLSTASYEEVCDYRDNYVSFFTESRRAKFDKLMKEHYGKVKE